MRILLLARYGRLGASSRVRFEQFLPQLRAAGHEIVSAPLFDDDYLTALYGEGKRKTTAVLAAYANRLGVIRTRGHYDLVWMEKEALPWMPASFEAWLLRGGPPMVVDYDDADFADPSAAERLPQGEYDIPMVIQDKRFDGDGQLVFNDRQQRGLYGDVLLVNGVPWPRLLVKDRPYRFRLLNGGTSRVLQLGVQVLQDGRPQPLPLLVVASDSGLLPQAVPCSSLRMGVAERYEVIVDFRGLAGKEVFLINPNGVLIGNGAVNQFLAQWTNNMVRPEQFEALIAGRRLAQMPVSTADVFAALRKVLAADRMRRFALAGFGGDPPGTRWDIFRRLEQEATVEVVPVLVESLSGEVDAPQESELRGAETRRYYPAACPQHPPIRLGRRAASWRDRKSTV